MEKFDVIVIGAGIMGSCTAYKVAKRGHTVLLLEQYDFLHHCGSSHGQSRTIRLTYPEECYVGMAVESSRLWDEAEEEAGYRVVTKTAQFDFGMADNRSLQLSIDNCLANSIPVRVVGKSDVGKEFSGVFTLPEGWIGGVTERGGVINPTKAVAMFQSLASRHGAVLKDRVKVTDITKVDGGVVRVSTVSGLTFHGKKCVVTAGAWTNKLMESITSSPCIFLPIEPLHTEVCYWKIKPPYTNLFTPESGFPTFASYGNPYIYGTPSIEYPGLVKISLNSGELCDPERRSWQVDMELLEKKVKPWIKTVFPNYIDIDAGPVITYTCMYSMTPDADYVIDYVGGDEFGEDLVVVGGFSGHGFKMGPLVGSIVAGMVLDDHTGNDVDLSHFRISRFMDDPRGNLKDYEDFVSLQKQ